MTDQHRVAVALIGDVVSSRTSADRADLQRDLVTTLDGVNRREPAVQELAPTIGDEFQAVYADVRTALRATLLVRLSLPDGVDCRFGLGLGDVVVVGRSDYGLTQDGSAWWSAREAIDEAKHRETRRNRTLRTWFVDGRADEHSPDAGLVNAYLLLRDELVSGFGDRSRRLALGHVLGTPQKDLAAEEGITQGAVSQNLRSSGALAVVGGLDLLGGVA